MMIAVEVLRPAALSIPVVLAAALLFPATVRVRGAALLATLWSFAALLAVNAVAVEADWWTFGTDGAEWAGIPVDVILGWAVLWGAVPVLLSVWVSPWLSCAVLVGADVIAMPNMAPMVSLSESWWLGEILAIVIGLAPAVLLGVLTTQQQWLGVRIAVQVVLFGALLGFLLPTATFAATGASWSERLQYLGGPLDLILLQLAVLVGIVALRAVAEFGRHGGTPFPWDPPPALVRTGPYAYVANPMQLGGVLLLLLGSVAVADPWLSAAAVVAVAFSSGIAGWNERDHLRARFGADWVAYRRDTRDWLPRWRPSPQRQAGTLFVAVTCDPCSVVGAWFERRAGYRLSIESAEHHPDRLRRIRYESTTVQADGTRAIGCALEHLNLGWAIVGWIVRAPLLGWLVQVVAVAMGAGPRTVEAR